MKTKLVLFVIVTLIIGFVLGMLTSAKLRLHKMRPVSVYYSPMLFREGFYKLIEPDDMQKAEIEKILDKYAKQNWDLQENFRKSYDSSMKEFRKEIESKLTKVQLDRIKEMDEKRNEMFKQSMKNMGRPDTNHRRDQRWPDRDRRPFPDGGRFEGRPPLPDGRMPRRPDDSITTN